MDSRDAIIERFVQDIRQGESERGFPGAVDALQRVLDFKPEYPPELDRQSDMYSAGDEDAPFFSEAMLYNLLGKEDARTLRGRLRMLCRALGVDEYGW